MKANTESVRNERKYIQAQSWCEHLTFNLYTSLNNEEINKTRSFKLEVFIVSEVIFCFKLPKQKQHLGTLHISVFITSSMVPQKERCTYFIMYYIAMYCLQVNRYSIVPSNLKVAWGRNAKTCRYETYAPTARKMTWRVFSRGWRSDVRCIHSRHAQSHSLDNKFTFGGEYRPGYKRTRYSCCANIIRRTQSVISRNFISDVTNS